MRTPLVAGNWKMNTTVSEAVSLVRQMLEPLNTIDGVEKLICPPFVSLVPVASLLKGSSVRLGAQNMHFADKGAYTGEVSPVMIAGFCQYVIVGHSERRQYFGEDDRIVNRKIAAAFAHGIKPILCVGERLDQNNAGMTEVVVRQQINGALDNIIPTRDLVIAYEPVWAIGTGKAATATQAADTISLIRDTVARLWGSDVAFDLRVLYGGSVTSENISEFIREPQIDGALVGGASLKPDDFVSIVRQTARIKGTSSPS
ncbi:MAG: triose-phosphate isomerase [Dehalococcoidia bacterium]|nr:triose-phosphate isomerase [Dehalococcoidia bacterium]